jgi:2,3-bisphosphoglycerate-independent phosphoglycerate mutase
MSDLPVEELGGKTPMTVANKPNMDRLAGLSEAGMAKTVPESLPPGSDVANLSVLGYDPQKYYSGRSPLEAASMGIEMSDSDVAIRCNIVKLSQAERFEDAVMLSYCADDIHTSDAARVIEAAQRLYGNERLSFHAGISYRHCLIVKNGQTGLDLTPPHDITGQKIGDYIGSGELFEIMERSWRHDPDRCLWFWGEGKKANLPLFKDEFGLDASLISAVDLLRGIGKITGMDVIIVPGATGYIDTNFEGKAQAAIDSLRAGADLAYIHVEAPDECGHRGEVANKVKSIELIDGLVLGRIIKAFEAGELGERIRILVSPDHPTPLCTKTHSREPVPYFIYDSGCEIKGVECFDEINAQSTGFFVDKGHDLMRKLICRT